MKNLIFLLLSFLFIQPFARADGFVCEGKNTGLMLKLYNHNLPKEGTRTPELMILSNPRLLPQHQILAQFTQGENLKYLGNGKYIGKNNHLNVPNAIVANMKIEQLDRITLAIEFAYTHVSTAAAKNLKSIPGTITYQNIHGEPTSEPANCIRYLRNPPKNNLESPFDP